MATWQFDLNLLPRKKLLELYGEQPSFLDEETRESASSWNDIKLTNDCETYLMSLLPEQKSWSTQIRMLGDEDGDRIELIGDETCDLAEISVRIDVRVRNQQFLEGLVTFANCSDAVFLIIENLEVVEADLNALELRIKDSNAYRFVEDPLKFFENLRSSSP